MSLNSNPSDFDVKLKYGGCYPGYFLLIKAIILIILSYFIIIYSIPTYLVISGNSCDEGWFF